MAFVFTVMRKQGHKSRVMREVMNRDLKKREEVLKVENVRESTGGREKDLGNGEKRVLWLSPAASNSPGAGFTYRRRMGFEKVGVLIQGWHLTE